MFEESRVLLKVLARLMTINIVALPIHDGLMVACSKTEAALRAMKEGAEEVTGFPFPVEVKS